MDIAGLLGDNVASAIEHYMISSEPEVYLASLPETREKKIISLLIKSFNYDLKDELIKGGIPSNLAN